MIRVSTLLTSDFGRNPRKYNPSKSVTEQLGEGGMATVYKAYQPSLDRFVAIKVLPPQHAKTAGFRERFFLEARAVAQLSHPNILPVYDVGMENDICYLVMKCINGCSMRDIIGEKMVLPRVCRFIDQVSGALDHAHGRGIIHRDIKSPNLLLEGEWVFLTDSGMERRRKQPEVAGGGPERVWRGGGWHSPPGLARCATRSSHAPGFRRSALGFRLVKTD